MPFDRLPAPAVCVRPFGQRDLRVELLPWCLLRTPGFGADLVKGLADPRAQETLERSLDSIGEGPAEDPAASRAAQGQYDRSIRDATAVLASVAADQDFAHAVYLSSRDFYEHGLVRLVRGDPLREKRVRRIRSTLARYVRRMSVRCEQTSFFGPVHFALLDPAVPAGVEVAVAGQGQIYVEPATWLLEELASRAVQAVSLTRRVLRPHPAFRAAADHLVHQPTGRRLRTTPDALRLFCALDGAADLATAAAAAGVEEAALPGTVGALGPAVEHLGLPAHEFWPFERLASTHDGDPLIRRLVELRDAATRQPWPARKAAIDQAEIVVREAGIDSRRGEGRHYADRYVLHEEFAHSASGRTVLGGPAVHGILAALERILPLSLLAALLAREDARSAVRGVLGGRSLPLARVLAADVPDPAPRIRRLRERLADLVAARTMEEGSSARLSSEDIDALVVAFEPELLWDDQWVTLAGPDLMAAGTDLANATWVLSELHDDGSYLAGGVTRVHPDGVVLRETLQALVEEAFDVTRMAAVVGRRRGKFLLPEMPGLSIELGGTSTKPRNETVPLSAVEVAEDGSALLIDGRRYLLYSGDVPSVVHRALSVPALRAPVMSTGPATPRIYVDDVVVRRATWRLELPGGLGGFDGWRQAALLRRQWSLPQRVFVRHPAEPKPLFVDFADPLSVSDVMHLPAATVEVTEMLPDLDELWWRPDGRPTCSELRLACLVRVLARSLGPQPPSECERSQKR